MGVGEIDDGVYAAEVFRRERGIGGIFFCARDSDAMSALGGDFGHERSSFSTA